MSHDEQPAGGPSFEQWVVRVLAGLMVLAVGGAVVGSINEIKRYWHIKTM